jgi:hypothetical protein
MLQSIEAKIYPLVVAFFMSSSKGDPRPPSSSCSITGLDFTFGGGRRRRGVGVLNTQVSGEW